MKFLDHTSTDYSVLKRNFESYQKYLQDHKAGFPLEAYEFATAEWHYDPNDHRCPHDAWLESLQINEAPRTAGRVDMQIKLLGAYHDGYLLLQYNNVISYKLSGYKASLNDRSTHGDWLIDEVGLSETAGSVIHEILFASGITWEIESQNIKFAWSSIET